MRNLNYSKLKARFPHAKVYSFDIFDTLIFRDVPIDFCTYSIIEKICANDSDNTIYSFAKYRNSISGETLDEIYAKLQKLTGCNSDILNFYKLCEEDCEMKLACANHEILNVLREAKADRKRVLLVSDMHLSKEVITRILSHAGVEEGKEYDRLYVSSECGLTKRRGDLFDHVLEKEKIDANVMVHVGDAFRSDFLMPRRMGINAVYYGKGIRGVCLKKVNQIKMDINELDIINTFCCNHTQERDYYSSFGYKCVGPLLYGFSLWLDKEIEESGYDGIVFFLAREGAVFKTAYEKVRAHNNPTEYFMISRRSIVGALLWREKSLREKIYVFEKHGMLRNASSKTIVALLNISTLVENDKEWVSLQDKTYRSIQELINDNAFIEFLMKYEKEIDKESYRQYTLLNEYIREYDDSKTLIVDIGWKGTIQTMLNSVLESLVGENTEKTPNLNGLYLGVKRRNCSDDKKGYLFDRGRGIPESEIFAFGGLLESILSETEGSVIRYERNTIDETVNPIRGAYEYNDEDKEKIKSIQQGAYDYINDICASPLGKYVNCDRESAVANIVHFMLSPTKKDIEYFERLTFKDDSYEAFNLDNKGGSIYKSVMNSNWKVGYIKKMIGTWIPAKTIYKLMYNIREGYLYFK